MFHPSLLFFHTHFDITFLSIFLPNFPVLKAQDIEMFGYLAKSDANTGYEPKQFDKITFVDNDTMLIDDPDLDEISDFSKNTRDNTGMFGVPSMFETSVSHVSHGDFALEIEDKRKHASANRLLDRGRERKKGSVISVAELKSKKSRQNSIWSHSLLTCRKFFSDERDL